MSCWQVYLENPKPEEGAEDDPAIMTSHIIRAPPVLCAQVGESRCPGAATVRIFWGRRLQMCYSMLLASA